MQRMWTKIGLGALGVFLVGLLLISVFRESEVAMAQVVRTKIAPAIRSAVIRHALMHGSQARSDLDFTLNGDALGTVTSMVVSRVVRNQPLDINLVVRLDDDAEIDELASCDLVPSNQDDLGLDDGFGCAGHGDRDLVQIGEARFEPQGLVRPIFVSKGRISQLSRGDTFHADVDLTHGADIVAQGKGNARVQLHADSSGARVRVSDGKGGDLVHVDADSNGAFIRIRDNNGREVFRLLADGKGVSLDAGPPVESH